MLGQALGQWHPVAHGQPLPSGQRLVEHVDQGARQAADAGLRHPKASGLLLQGVGFAIGQQEKSFISGPGKVAVARSWCAGIRRRSPSEV